MQNDPTIEVLDNSDLDLTGTPLRNPVIDKQWVLSRIKNLYWEKKKTKDGQDAKQLVIETITEQEATSIDGKTVNPGHVATTTIWATPSGGLTQAMINQKVARFQAAVLKLTEPKVFGSPDQYIGQLVKAYYVSEADRNDSSVLYQRINRWEKAS